MGIDSGLHVLDKAKFDRPYLDSNRDLVDENGKMTSEGDLWSNATVRQICEWRNWYQLHNWMKSLVELKGGDPHWGYDDCRVQLTEGDLDNLLLAEKMIEKTKLQRGYPWDTRHLADPSEYFGSIGKVVAEAKEALKENPNHSIWYS